MANNGAEAALSQMNIEDICALINFIGYSEKVKKLKQKNQVLVSILNV